MKKRIAAIIICLMLCGSFSIPAFAESTTAPELPKVMVSSCSVKGTAVGGNTVTLSITLCNLCRKAGVKNMKVRFSEPTGTIVPVKVGSTYVSSMTAGGKYKWSLPVKIAEKAPGGNYTATVSCDYETPDGQSLSSEDSFTITLGKTEKEKQETTTVDSSQPRLMISSCRIETGFVSPDEERNLTLIIKNTSNAKSADNIKLSLSDPSGELKPSGTGSVYIDSIPAGGTYSWVIPISASHTAKPGEHTVTLQMEYEDRYKTPFTGSDSFGIDVRQPAKLGFSGAQLPVKVTQGENANLTISFMNTGKSVISNCMFEISCDGIATGGSVLVGEIKAGETKTGTSNFRADTDFLGETSGTITISYEDEFGETYTEEVAVSTIVQKKAEVTKNESSEEKSGNKLWWLFILIGFISGGGAGFGITFAVFAARQKKRDEEML